jgi:hypothetical protein
MAKTKPARRARSGARKNTRPTTRQRTRRASGAQHRKKARTREKTHHLVDVVLNFANYGKWPLGKTEWLTVYDPTPDEKGTFNPVLADLHQYVVANLESLSSREGSRTAVQTPIEVFAEILDDDLARADRSDDVLKKLRGAWALCEAMFQHLKKDGGSTLIYRCITCRKWFVAWKHDPRDQGRPYCGKRCWPADSFRDAVAPARRVQSKKTETP